MNPETFRTDYLPLRDALYRVAFCLLGARDEAEDAVQDLYLKLWQSGKETEKVQNPKAWCLTLLRNSCLDRLKSKRLRDRSSLDGVEPEPQPEDGTLHAREREKAVFDAIEKLPERERKVLKMKVLDEMSYEQIEKYTGIPYLTLRVLLSGARKKLRKSIERCEIH